MSISILRFLVLGLLVCSLTQGAELDLTEDKSEVEESTFKKRPLEVGFVYGSYKYVEPGLMKVEGSLFGVQLSYFKNRGLLRGGFEAEYLTGAATYNGSLVNTRTLEKTPYSTEDSNWYVQGRGLLGIQAVESTRTNLSFLSGIGYRNLQNSSEGIGSYDRIAYYIYMPIQTSYEYLLFENFSVGIEAEYDLFLTGKTTSKLSQISPFFNDIENKQNSGAGYRFAIPFRVRWDSTDLVVRAYYRRWDISDSEVAQSGSGLFLEPENTTDQYGFSLSASL